MSTVQTQKNEECCPEFHPEKWDNKTLNWNQKPFIKETIPTFFHMPLPKMIGKKVTKMMKLAENTNNISTDKLDVLLLFNDPSAFKSNMYLSVIGNVPNANNTTITGTFIGKVFDGTYNQIPKFIKQMNSYLKDHDKKTKDYYTHYAYCPKCARKFGHNYMILFAEITQ
ncbi:hydrolase [Flavivirga rizhaonensis]|uniref:Uncharacterized protein n=1 Tax=Flavivirga rizhaonensis TaxID=2559571 RepID=A0A4S1E1D5_9FLAO|nr:hydrolase [Flavivirga rizhaonensis]TGV04350.1 hypothetical protein EM932_02185 [Flavivirga rizhaonensis]